MKHQADMERKIADLYDKDEDLPTFGMGDIYWAEEIEKELGWPRPPFMQFRSEEEEKEGRDRKSVV